MLKFAQLARLFFLVLALNSSCFVLGSEERLNVDMQLNTLWMAPGREYRVPCRVNRGLSVLFNSTVEFLQSHYIEPTDPYTGEVTLTRNGHLVGGDSDHYGIEVTSTSDSTTFTLIFKNPRRQDNGELYCRLKPSRDIAPAGMVSMSSSRFVGVTGIRKRRSIFFH